MKKITNLLKVNYKEQIIAVLVILAMYLMLISMNLYPRYFQEINVEEVKVALITYKIYFFFTIAFISHSSFRLRLTLSIDNGFTRLNFFKSEIFIALMMGLILSIFETVILLYIRLNFNANALQAIDIYGSYSFNFIINFIIYYAMSLFVVNLNSILFRFSFNYLKLPYFPIYIIAYLYFYYNMSRVIDNLQPALQSFVGLIPRGNLVFILGIIVLLVVQTMLAYLLIRTVQIKPYHNVFKIKGIS